jgi:hypothetical protein
MTTGRFMSLLFLFAILVILGGCSEPQPHSGATGLDSCQMSLGKAPGARFEISIDGVPRTYRDQRDTALEGHLSWSNIQ